MPSTIKGLRDESIAREKVEGGGRIVNGSRLETIIQNVASDANFPDDVTLESTDGEWSVKDGAITDAKVATGISADKLVDGSTNHTFTASDDTKLAGIEVGADVTDAGNIGSSIHGAAAKTTPIDADTLPLIDSAASNVLKNVSWASIRATLKTYFDTLYSTVTTFLALTDTPGSYSGNGSRLLRVKSDASGLEFHALASDYVVRGGSGGEPAVGLIQDDNATVGINGNPGVGLLNISYAGTTYNGLYISISNGSGLTGVNVAHAGNTPGVEVEHTGTGGGGRFFVNNGSSTAAAVDAETTGDAPAVKATGGIALHVNGGLQHATTLVTGTTHTLAINQPELHFKLSAACAVALPSLATLPVGWRCRLRDINNTIATNNVTFNRDGSDLFASGATSWIWATSNESADLVVVDFGSGSKRWYHS
jgi:hypothetical protein